MSKYRLIRGAALPETALVMTATLAMVFGIIQIGVIGFMQVMVDGAAFIAAHEYALGDTANYAAKTKLVFPQVNITQLNAIVIDPNPPDVTSVAVNYNTANTTTRHGGVSLVRATRAQATVTQNAPTGLLGVGIAALSHVAIHGSAIEPQELVSNTVYDANGQGYTGTAASQVQFFPSASAVGGNPQNAPANYVSQHYMSVCAGTFTTACGSTTYRALGTAVFLDHDNWQRTNLGVGPYSSNYTFGELECHQQMFALAAQTVFKPAATSAAMPQFSVSPAAKLLLAPAVIQTIYNWDYVGNGGYGATESSFGLYPLHPALGCP